MAVARNISREHTDLAVRDFAGGPGVLARNAARRLALLEKTGFINHQHRVGIGQRFDDVVAHDVTQRVGVPLSAPQHRLLSPRTRITGRLGAHPAGLTALLAEQPIQEQAGRDGHALLLEQRPHPRLDVAQCRRPKFQCRLDRRTRHHDLRIESWSRIDSEIGSPRNCSVSVSVRPGTS